MLVLRPGFTVKVKCFQGSSEGYLIMIFGDCIYSISEILTCTVGLYIHIQLNLPTWKIPTSVCYFPIQICSSSEVSLLVNDTPPIYPPKVESWTPSWLLSSLPCVLDTRFLLVFTFFSFSGILAFFPCLSLGFSAFHVYNCSCSHWFHCPVLFYFGRVSGHSSA